MKGGEEGRLDGGKGKGDGDPIGGGEALVLWLARPGG